MKKINIEKISFDLVKIPKGEILLNDDRIKKKWSVNINEFYLFKISRNSKIVNLTPMTITRNHLN